MTAEPFTLPSFAKINLLLRVLGKRDDGFHELCTVFQTVSLKDFLTFSAHRKLILTCNNPKIPTDDKNLIIKAAKKLREKYKIRRGAHIYLEKNIPAPGGLGGGSSNAAVALIGLARLWKIKFNLAELCEIGKTLGADVPFFFRGGTAIGVGRGDELFPVKDLEPKSLLIVTPNIAVSTAAAFAQLNLSNLTNKPPKSILQICRGEANTVDLRQIEPVNDFEDTVFKIEPEIEFVKKRLLDLGAEKALMSGSGASVFAIFADEDGRQKAFEKLKNEQKSWRAFTAQTVARGAYLASLNIENSLQ
ncbi:MAG: 4-(cytidine 5'-diphospho)-2-C-methyl-D-erythritol kinase [Acidobacteriota bacterium]|nr:4-(cytidine 5'-diphospho)-2-C-methyl-D-erythritol kinase [Acidobacteriota bacterium]